jgi:4-amino-4-deoxy-L-arabinose transferase-like glycosyltransferase
MTVGARWADRLADLLRRRPAAAVFIAGLFLLAPGIHRETSVTGQDEYWLSFRTPMEMRTHGDWLTPWLNGAPRLQKPPLVYVFTAGAYHLLGTHPAAARLSGVLSGAALAALTCLLYRRLFGGTGLTAGLIALASLGIVIDSRRCMLDVPLAAGVTWAVYAGVRWAQTDRWRHAGCAAVALALAFLAKGPAAWMFFGIAAVTGVTCHRRWGWLHARRGTVLAWLGLTLLLCLAWPVAMWLRWPQFLATVGHEVGEWKGGRLYLPLLVFAASLGLAFPWSAVTFAGVWRVARRFRAALPAESWLVLWYLAGVAPFFFMKSFERYMQPLVPVQAILAARALAQAAPALQRRHLRVAVALQTVPIGLMCAFLLWFERGVPGALATLLALAILWCAACRARPAPAAIALGLGAVFTLFLGLAYPGLGIGALPPGIEQGLATKPVAVYAGTQPAMLSMRLGRSVIPLRHGDDAALAAFLSAGGGTVFTLAPHGPLLEETAWRAGARATRRSEFSTFYSRKTWIRFARPDATRADWAAAFASRRLDGLSSRIVVYEME